MVFQTSTIQFIGEKIGKIFDAFTSGLTAAQSAGNCAKTTVIGNNVAHGMTNSISDSKTLSSKLPGSSRVYINRAVNN